MGVHVYICVCVYNVYEGGKEGKGHETTFRNLNRNSGGKQKMKCTYDNRLRELSSYFYVGLRLVKGDGNDWS